MVNAILAGRSLENVCVPPTATVAEALRTIDATGAEACFVVEHDRRLIGIITDGDVRRALLAGCTLADSVDVCTNRSFTSVSTEIGRAEALDLMMARTIVQLPVVDAQGRLVGLHLLRELLGHVERPNWAVIMAGGEGTRLRPITERIPKPMVRIAGRPLLERLVLHLVGYGVTRIFLSVKYLSEVIERHFGDGSAFGCQIEYLHETQPLDSGGAITLLPERPAHPFLVMNGDLLTQVNVDRLLANHENSASAITVGVREYPVTIPFGVVERDDEGRLLELKEKPVQSYLINAGVYVVSPPCLDLIERGKPVTMPDVLLRANASGLRVGVYTIEDDWLDIGRPEDLQRARGER